MEHFFKTDIRMQMIMCRCQYITLIYLIIMILCISPLIQKSRILGTETFQ